MKRGTLYLAYGSNLHIEQMQYRCQTAKVFGLSRIADYRLTFKALGNCAYATIEPCVGSYVPIVVWEIQENDEWSLDRYEGYPSHYGKEQMVVKVRGRNVRGMVYIMNHQAVQAVPDLGYFNTVLMGYRSFGLEEHLLYAALHGVKKPQRSDDKALCFYRHMRGMTQEQLAVRSSLPVRSIQKYESGERLIGRAQAETVLKLAQALEVPIHCLLERQHIN